MDIEQLKIFVAVYRNNGIAPVAHQLNLAPSSVSRSLASLESQLETRLFHRTTRKVTPTEEGEAFYHRIAPLIEEFEFAFNTLKKAKELPTGRLRMTSSVSFGQIVLIPLIKEFQQRYPEIDLELVLSDRNVDLIDDRIDLAIRHGQLSDSSLVARKLIETKYLVVASPAYLKSVPPIIKPQDISEHSIISFSMKELRSEWQFVNGDMSESVSITPQLVISNANAIRQCAKNNLGLALLANWTIDEDLKDGSLVPVLPEWQSTVAHLGSTVWLVLPSKSFLPKKTKVLFDYLLEKIQ